MTVMQIVTKFFYKNIQKGFTIIELLIVITIIGILTGVTYRIINPNELNKKARDSQRISDARMIQTALENYFFENRAYPIADNNIVINGSDAISNKLVSGGFIEKVPTDPKELNYVYISKNGTTYTLMIPQEFLLDNECLNTPYDESYGCKEFRSAL